MTTTEKYFKARATSFRKIIFGGYEEYSEWVEGVNAYLVDGEWVRNDRYDLTQSYPDFKKWVLEKMWLEGYKMIIGDLTVGGYMHTYVEWNWRKKETAIYKEIIKNNEILEAAVVAATRYWEENNEKIRPKD